MKKKRASERPTLDLMEEAVHLLRSAPLSIFGWYLFGTLPFLLGLLYFCTDMSWSAVAFQHRAETSLGVAGLFLWMKTCQVIFCAKLRAHFVRRAAARIGFRDFVGLAVAQAIVQPAKLFLLPAAALATIPFGWVWAFFENATALGHDQSTRKFIAKCWRQAGFWPRQNHAVILIYLLLLAVVFLNLGIIVFLLPHLLRIFTGVESVFTQSPQSFMNTTSLAVVGGLTYVVCDPLLKAVYTLRCFHGDALHSGEDLAVEVRALPRLGAVLAVTLLLGCLPSPARATEPAATSPPIVSTSEMNRAIDETMKEPRFGWRLPRQSESEVAGRKWPFVDALGRFFRATGRIIKRAFNAIGRMIGRLFSRDIPLPAVPAGRGWETSSRNWLIAVLVVLGAIVIALVAQTLRQIRLRNPPDSSTSAAPPKPDLADENLTADLLPEDEWLALARDHLRKGEVRFALRAFFLGGLAHLATREVLTLARHKSNRDYRAELRRKAGDQPPLLAAFEQNIVTLERVWYGRHQIDQPDLEHFETNLEQIRKC